MTAIETVQPLPAGRRKSGWFDTAVNYLVKALLVAAKTAKVTKVVLLSVSLAAYSVLFSWQFAVLIIFSLFVHESGHIWQMKREGMKSKGIYFIPFLGGVALGESDFPSRRAEVKIALMGPVWGLGLALVTAGVYVLTRYAIFAAAAGWMCLINVFNLAPVNPLDGGRVLKSIAFSLHSLAGFAFLILGFFLAIAFSFKVGLGLVLFLLLIGLAETVYEFKRRSPREPLSKVQMLLAAAGYGALALVLITLMEVMTSEPGARLALRFLEG